MYFGRCNVGFVEFDGRGIERRGGITPVALESRYWSVTGEHDVRIIACFEAALEIGFFFRVRRADCVSRSLGSLERIGNGESDVLTVISDEVVFERRPPLQANTIEPWRRS